MLVAQPETKLNTTYTAPLGSIDLRAFDDDGNPYKVTNCYHCLPWHAVACRGGP
ncbi:hypothetical protein RW1_069_00020 [Rhodococcus wratislaviensis NBRC 100605]|uniref:Uncharacterized protein n=1 Tax=Rhodococcus wratislaviensis NBRC 100605 TaxID=1219028 RepID=X0PZL4_RHOWR|nr:hypothetical protein RW1_069_00020 [Rhodococcus wratislaviensis NBRC 100605]